MSKKITKKRIEAYQKAHRELWKGVETCMINIDFTNSDKNILVALIQRSLDTNLPIDMVITQILEEYLEGKNDN